MNIKTIPFKISRDVVWYEEAGEPKDYDGWTLFWKGSMELQYKQYYIIEFIVKNGDKFYKGELGLEGNSKIGFEVEENPVDVTEVEKREVTKTEWVKV